MFVSILAKRYLNFVLVALAVAFYAFVPQAKADAALSLPHYYCKVNTIGAVGKDGRITVMSKTNNSQCRILIEIVYVYSPTKPSQKDSTGWHIATGVTSKYVPLYGSATGTNALNINPTVSIVTWAGSTWTRDKVGVFKKNSAGQVAYYPEPGTSI